MTTNTGNYKRIDLFGIREGSDSKVVIRDAHENRTLAVDDGDKYFHLHCDVSQNVDIEIDEKNLHITYGYLSECEDIFTRGIQLLDFCAEPQASRSSQTVSHFEPSVNWMNDPNGLVQFHDVYHMFYQFDPFGWNWGPMHWGHAVSHDLVHWAYLPIAIDAQDIIYADNEWVGGAFSGSALAVDEQGQPCNGHDAYAINFFLTYHEDIDGQSEEKQLEYQAICTSVDGIHVSEPHEIVDRSADKFGVDFRDSKVDMTALRGVDGVDDGTAFMSIATNLPVGFDQGYFSEAQGVHNFTAEAMTPQKHWFTQDGFGQPGEWSPNLTTVPVIAGYIAGPGKDLGSAQSWTYTGALFADYEYGISKTFECPDTFELDGTKVSIGALMHVKSESGSFQPVRWYSGDISNHSDDNKRPQLRLDVNNAGLCDFGSAFYAVQSFEDQHGRRIAVGWLADWFEQRSKSTSRANGVMTYPRELHVVNGRLTSYPVQEVFEQIVGSDQPANIYDGAYYSSLSLDTNKSADFSLTLATKGDASIQLIRANGEVGIRINGTRLGEAFFTSQVTDVRTIEVFVDGTACEVFINHGEDAASFVFDAEGDFSQYQVFAAQDYSNFTEVKSRILEVVR